MSFNINFWRKSESCFKEKIQEEFLKKLKFELKVLKKKNKPEDISIGQPWQNSEKTQEAFLENFQKRLSRKLCRNWRQKQSMSSWRKHCIFFWWITVIHPENSQKNFWRCLCWNLRNKYCRNYRRNHWRNLFWSIPSFQGISEVIPENKTWKPLVGILITISWKKWRRNAKKGIPE